MAILFSSKQSIKELSHVLKISRAGGLQSRPTSVHSLGLCAATTPQLLLTISAISNFCPFCCYSLYSPIFFLLLTPFTNPLLLGFNKQKLAKRHSCAELNNQGTLVGFVLFCFGLLPCWCSQSKYYNAKCISFGLTFSAILF